ncbi:HDOD domain-containing protein [Massilia sp. KIM]|uniref:HDOD domain-containing protein n=1 Tax=Massilia sp. KIM TaxID=1955422 RepID=UPI00098E8E6F|nr:HDOD domain-containing protein [Massilia sp. KIM]OON63238.1 HDOD domain-containing protein [Massilia sp. KIM]
MKTWLSRLFGGARAVQSTHPAAPPAAAPVGRTQPEPTRDLAPAFMAWLIGPCGAPAIAGAGVVLDELERLAARPEEAAQLVPRVPELIPQLLRGLRDEASSAADMARLVAQDPVLVAELLREVNSPYYNPAKPVRNLEGALMLLGQNGLRMLLARVAFRPIINLQTGPIARQLAPRLWAQSEKSALAASLLAPDHGADAFEAYLAGLVSNVGLVVALRIADQALPAGLLPDDEAYALALLGGARRLSARIAAQWELPPAVAGAIAHPEGGALSRTLAAAERLATLRLLADAAQPGCVRAAGALDPALRRVFDQLQDRED